MKSGGSYKSLRIAVLSETHTRGGAERQGYLLATELRRQGHDARVLSFFSSPKNIDARVGLSAEFPGTSTDHIVPRIIQFAALPYQRLLNTKTARATRSKSNRVMNSSATQSPNFSRQLLAHLFMVGAKRNLALLLAELMCFHLATALETRLLIKFLKRERYNIVISFLPGHNAIAVLAGRALGIPVVVSERNDVLRQPVSSQTQWTRSKLYPHADMITANTEFSVQQLKGALPHSRVIWQPNKQYFSPDSKKSKKFAPDLYVIARLEPQKQIDTVIKALPILGELGFFSPLHIFGEGPDEPRLKGLVYELGLDTQVHFRSYVPSKEIFGQVVEPGVFISNSLYEGSSNSLHESVAAGLIPVVSETVSEIHGILRPELVASLVTKGSSEDIAAKVCGLLQRPDLAQQLRAEVLVDFNAYWNRREAALNQAISAIIRLA